MAKTRIAVFCAVILAAVLFLLIPHHSVKASGPGPCIGACGTETTPPATCLGGGGTPSGPFASPTVATAGTPSIYDIPQQQYCTIVITQVVADAYATTTAPVGVTFGVWAKQNGTCANPTTLIWSKPMIISQYTPQATFQYFGDQGFIAESGEDVCVGFSNNFSGIIQNLNVTFVYR